MAFGYRYFMYWYFVRSNCEFGLKYIFAKFYLLPQVSLRSFYLPFYFICYIDTYQGYHGYLSTSRSDLSINTSSFLHKLKIDLLHILSRPKTPSAGSLTLSRITWNLNDTPNRRSCSIFILHWVILNPPKASPSFFFFLLFKPIPPTSDQIVGFFCLISCFHPWLLFSVLSYSTIRIAPHIIYIYMALIHVLAIVSTQIRRSLASGAIALSGIMLYFLLTEQVTGTETWNQTGLHVFKNVLHIEISWPRLPHFSHQGVFRVSSQISHKWSALPQ